jgi:hypothetical protein
VTGGRRALARRTLREVATLDELDGHALSWYDACELDDPAGPAGPAPGGPPAGPPADPFDARDLPEDQHP